ncbi:4'-phosphopantetheinyl transferase family protein [Corynebacterium pacaense]|uniref:4'-phosphopantetheinyl transferase family protein n=1 Tax=Corynebacterium pacaense TaxID=1816684 RepID=UPI0015C4D654|nr:4'-phosphopantetheinyl transferase superfamily protein [Corynebacterium pacaense]
MDLSASRIDTGCAATVHLFTANSLQGLVDAHTHLLTAAELQRAGGRSQRLESYILLRLLLSEATGIGPGDLDLRVGAPGIRTHLHGVADPPRISLSRTNGYTAVALARGPVGIDVETTRPTEQCQLLLSLLHPSDRRRLNRRRFPRFVFRREVTAAWTRKEATLKAQAVGLSRDPALDEVGTRRTPLAPPGYRVLNLNSHHRGVELALCLSSAPDRPTPAVESGGGVRPIS